MGWVTELAHADAKRMKMERYVSSCCPLCGFSELIDFFESSRSPVSVCYLWDSPEKARHAPMGAITLAYCPACDFIHNRRFTPDKSLFEPGYEASLTFSQLFRTYLQDLATRLVESYDLNAKRILEIGCGEGDFLRLLCRLGDNTGLGIDPTIKQIGNLDAGRGRIRFIRDYFTAEHARWPFDFLCCLSVFESIPEPIEFLKIVRKGIGNRHGARLYFEVPNSMRYFASSGPWSIYYEQCSHFSRKTLPKAFVTAGFDVLQAGAAYADEAYVYVEAKPATASVQTANRSRRAEHVLPATLSHFTQSYRSSVTQWRRRLDRIAQSDQRAVVWGSGGKGISFLNTLDTADVITYVVDINPNRQNRYIPGSAQKVVAPEFLVQYQPDLIIITNGIYAREIRTQVEQLGLSCEYEGL